MLKKILDAIMAVGSLVVVIGPIIFMIWVVMTIVSALMK